MIGIRGHQLGTELVLSLTHRHADSNNVTNREEDEQPNRPKLVVLLSTPFFGAIKFTLGSRVNL